MDIESRIQALKSRVVEDPKTSFSEIEQEVRELMSLGVRCHRCDISNINKAVERIRETTSIADFCAHDLHLTLANHMTGMGIPRLVVKKIRGHVIRDITAVYDQHEYDFEKMRALRLWSGRLESILSGNFDFSRDEDKTTWLNASRVSSV